MAADLDAASGAMQLQEQSSKQFAVRVGEAIAQVQKISTTEGGSLHDALVQLVAKVRCMVSTAAARLLHVVGRCL